MLKKSRIILPDLFSENLFDKNFAINLPIRKTIF